MDYKSTPQIINNIKKEDKFNPEDVHRLLKEVYNYRSHGFEEKSEAETENGNYVYVPWGRDSFVYIVKNIQKKWKLKSFIDVGCGIGDKVILAYFFGNFEKVTGIELNETTYHIAKYFLLKGMFNFEGYDDYYKIEKNYKGWQTSKSVKVKKEILHKDAFNHNFSEYDFIYMYVPIAKSPVMKKLYHKIFTEMPIGGIAIDVSGFPVEALHEITNEVKKKGRGYYHRYIRKVSEMGFEIYPIKSYFN